MWPLVVPRNADLIDAQGSKAVRKLGLESSPEIMLQGGAARGTLGGELGAKIEAHRTTLLAEFDALAKEVQDVVDGGLQSLFAKARERIAHELERIAEKTRASLEQREGANTARAGYSERARAAEEPRRSAC